MTGVRSRPRPGDGLLTLRRRGARSVAALLAVGGMVAAVRADATMTGPAPIPPQAHVTQVRAPGACTPRVPGPKGWSTITQLAAGGGRDAALEVAVDPFDPCVLYQATTSQHVDRSADAGRTWQPVLVDERTGTSGAGPLSAGGAGAPFRASALTVPGVHRVAIGERGNGDSVVVSADAGSTWALGSRGLGGAPVEQLAFAPSSASMAYAVTSTPSDLGVGAPAAAGSALGGAPFSLYLSADGGMSWTATASPANAASALGYVASQPPVVAIDPSVPQHLWALLDSGSQSASSDTDLLLESSDSGATWSLAGYVGPGAGPIIGALHVTQLLVVESQKHPRRLVAVGQFPDGTTVKYSDNDGSSWSSGSLPGLASAVVAADPITTDRLLYAAAMPGTATTSDRLVTYITTDGFDSVTALTPPTTSGRPLASGPVTPSSGAVPPGMIAEADVLGHFYLGVTASCASADAAAGGGCSSSGGVTFYQLTPSSAGVPGSADFPFPPVPTLPSPSLTTPLGTPLLQLSECPTPVHGTASGALAFDMEDLLYTEAGETGKQPLEGVIHRMNPSTCQDTGTLTVHFSRPDLLQIATTNNYTGATAPSVDTMVYDAKRNVVWLTLTVGVGYLFAAPVPLHSSGHAVDVAARLVYWKGQGCMPFLAYDPSDDSLWTCGPDDRLGSSHLSATTGKLLPDSCTALRAHARTGNGSGSATWVVSAPAHLLMQDEDDTTLYDYNALTCNLEQTYLHRRYSEPGAEDEQEACDPVTFGATSSGLVKATALWIRDAAASLVTAYALPTGACPLPTTTQYNGPTRVHAADELRLCGTLALTGRAQVLSGLPLVFLVDDQRYTVRTTGVDGVACTEPFLAPPVGQHQVRVEFPGDFSYLASHDLSPLVVIGPGVVTAARAVVVPPLPPPLQPVVQSIPIPQVGPAAQGQAQGQAQAQAQSQSQAQAQSQGAPQAVAVTQNQEQQQLQLAYAEQQGQAEEQGVYSMTDVADSPLGVMAPIAGVGVLLVFVWAGMAWALAAPSRVRARARRRSTAPQRVKP